MSTAVSRSVSAPVAKARIEKILRPKFSMPKQSSDGRVCIKHKEFISDISGSVLFSAQQYSVNPGLALSFPWLNSIAAAYETYRFKRLHFVFESSKSATTNGSVLLAMDFDPSDSSPTTKAQALAYNNAIRGPVWETFTYVCSPGDLAKMNQKFIRFGALSAGQDALLYDVGNLFVCPSGLPDDALIGELHVDYEVEMFTPQSDSTGYSIGRSGKYTAVGTISNTNWLGTSITQVGGVSANYVGGALFIQVPGQYLLTYIVAGTGITLGSGTSFSSLGNVVTLAGLNLNSAGTQLIVTLLVRIDVPNSGIIASNLFSSGVLTAAFLRVSTYALSLL